MTPSGIFVIETSDWWGSCLETSTVRPLLDLLVDGTPGGIEVAHFRVSTREELQHHVRRWRRTTRFPIVFFAMHGDPGRLYLGHRRSRRDTVTLDDLGRIIGPGCRDRAIHLGACSTLRLDRRHVASFLKATGVVAVTGFTKDLPWLRSAALELLVLSTMIRYRPTLDGARRMQRAIMRDVPGLRNELGLRVVLRQP